MNIFKLSYKVVRENSAEIYRGFGFKHLSDATQYYVHPDNQSFDGTTTLCQPIGEALILFTSMLQATAKGTPFGDFFVSDDRQSVFLDFSVPEDYRISGVVDRRVYRYRALSVGMEITLAAYDEKDMLIRGNMEHLHPLYKLLPSFMVLLGKEIDTNTEYRTVMDRFMESPVADVFVNLHEDFYQNHKMDEYELSYRDLSDMDTAGWHSWSESYAVIRENKAAAAAKTKSPIRQFPEDAFSREQKTLIPNLPSEFVLPENLTQIAEEICGRPFGGLKDCVATDEAVRILKEEGIAEAVLSEMARRIQFYMQKWAGGAMQVEVVVFSNVYGELAATECASEFIRILRQELTDAAKGGY